MQPIINRKILLVEDNTDLLREMTDYFAAKGNKIRAATSLSEAKKILDLFKPDVIVLDVILPDGSGLDLMKERENLPPVIVLSDLGDDDTMLDGFNLGACDYIVKPCSMIILETRIGLRLLSPKNAVVKCGCLVVDSRNRTAQCRGTQLALTATEFNLLWFFVNNPDRFFSSDEIYKRVWKAPALGTSTVRRHLSTLRQKLKQVANENLIYTEFGKGYACSSQEPQK